MAGCSKPVFTLEEVPPDACLPIRFPVVRHFDQALDGNPYHPKGARNQNGEGQAGLIREVSIKKEGNAGRREGGKQFQAEGVTSLPASEPTPDHDQHDHGDYD